MSDQTPPFKPEFTLEDFPDGPAQPEPTTAADLRRELVEIKHTLEIMKHLLAQLHQNSLSPANPFMPTFVPTLTQRKCFKCGLLLDGVMGYHCADPHCPTFTKTVC